MPNHRFGMCSIGKDLRPRKLPAALSIAAILLAITSHACGGGSSKRSSEDGGSGTPASFSWGVAEQIETDPFGVASENPQIAVDGTGRAVVVWRHLDLFLNQKIWANRFDGAVWSTAQAITTVTSGASESPQIAVDGAGNAIAVWQRIDNSNPHVWTSRFNGSTWGSAELIEGDNAFWAASPQIAMNRAGQAIAVWKQSDGSALSLWSRRFDGTTWGAASLMEGIDDWVDSPQIAIDDIGKAIIAWEQSTGAYLSIWTSRFDGTAWGKPELIETADAGHAGRAKIAMNGAGNAIVVWMQYDGALYNIWSNRFNGVTWGEAEQIGPGYNQPVAYPQAQIALNATANAMVVWAQHNGVRYDIWANRFNGSTWGKAELIESTNAGDAENPQIAIDYAGKAIAVWQQSDGARSNIWANRFNGSTWGTPELIENNDAGDAKHPQIGMDGAGRAIAVWDQFAGTSHRIWANRFGEGSPRK